MYPCKAFFACVAAVSSACIPQRNEPSQLVVCHSQHHCWVDQYSSFGQVRTRPHCIQHSRTTLYELERVADSGASLSLASVRAFAHLAIPPDLVYQCVEPTSAINFEAGNETTKSTEQVPVHGSKFGTFNHRILEACSLARSLGEMVNSGLPFVWVPGELPYFIQDHTSIHVKAKDQTW